MKFSRLRVVGFKSFVEPMEFVIGTGLTGVVGPNGCGKSNLVEALRWVMGENSYKNMRASGMDDVIFSGSLNRPARNTAEVILYLENDDRTAPAAFNDTDMLEVSRRIERESGSSYKINGKEVRARDVQLLFADASTGARSPAMVRQGQIGELISAKPTSRRQILEEAAGISGLHSRRREAEIRLRAAEQNLERLEDVLAQLEGRLDSLKKQSRQAMRYRNLSSEIRSAEAMILYLRWTEAGQALKEAKEQFSSAQKQETEAATLQADSAKLQAIAAHKIPELRDNAARAGATLQRLVIARNELDAEDRRVKERLQDLERHLIQLAEDVAREQQLVTENDEVLERLSEESIELRDENAMVLERTETAAERVEAAREDVQKSEAALGEMTRAQAQASAERQQLELRAGDARTRSSRLAAQADEARQMLEQLNSEMMAMQGIADHHDAVELALEALAEAEAETEVREEQTGMARMAEQAARQPLAEAERTLSALETEARTLENILSAALGGEWSPVVDSLQVEPGYEAALGAALGDDLDAPLDSASPVHWGEVVTGQEDDPALPEGITALGKYVHGPSVLRRRLSQIGLVTQEQAERLQMTLKAGQRLVSLEGGLWRWDGFVIGADAPTPAAQRLSQRNRLSELTGKIDAARDILAQQQHVLSESQTAVRNAQAAEQLARQQVRDRQTGLTQAREALAHAERAVSQLAARKIAAEERYERVTAETLEARQSIAEAEELLSQAPEVESFSVGISALQAEVSTARAALAEATAVSEGLAREKQMRDRRLETIEREYTNWKNRAANATRQIEVLRSRRQEAEGERAELIEAPEDIELKRRELFSLIAEAETAKKTRDDELQRAETDMADIDHAARTALEHLSEIRETKIRAEERLQAVLQRRHAIEERVDEDLDIAISALPDIAGLKEGAPLPDVEGVERKLDRLRQERERLGGVNLRAEEELHEVDEQRSSMIGERDDLIEAIRRLRTGISNLNREARERLLSSFEVVNDHFQRLFTHLFGGGTAELQLVDSDDPLDAGLEIIARPPGKKPQTMTLLSGGEQALTAMALIFAVFLTNPAPICVLDEVDAPLDDANVERYCDLLDEMSRRTQTRFVVITHNPITMARMRRLFGVTMAERGVSQLVSVDLETAESYRDVI